MSWNVAYLALPRCPCRVLPHCWVLGRTYAAQHSCPVAQLSPCTGTPPPPTHILVLDWSLFKGQKQNRIFIVMNKIRNMYVWQASPYMSRWSDIRQDQRPVQFPLLFLWNHCVPKEFIFFLNYFSFFLPQFRRMYLERVPTRKITYVWC